jgi:hypothetical protein
VPKISQFFSQMVLYFFSARICTANVTILGAFMRRNEKKSVDLGFGIWELGKVIDFCLCRNVMVCSSARKDSLSWACLRDLVRHFKTPLKSPDFPFSMSITFKIFHLICYSDFLEPTAICNVESTRSLDHGS